LTYTVYSPVAAQYVLAAEVRVANFNPRYDDPGNNKLVSLPAGTTVITRPFYIRTDDLVRSDYLVDLRLYDAPTFPNTDYGGQLLSGFAIVGATATPTTIIPTYTPTTVPTPGGSVVILSAWGPPGGQTIGAGSSFSMSYTINNTTSSTASVRLVGQLLPSGSESVGGIYDTPNQPTVSVPVGINTFSRTFTIASSSAAGTLDTKTSKNHTWVSVTGSTNIPLGSVTFNGTPTLNTTSITMQSGVTNFITGTFPIANTSGSAKQIILRMRIKPHGGTTYTSDLGRDSLVSVPTGNSTFTRPFAIPRYLASGPYDVVWELADPTFTGTIDVTSPPIGVNGLNITNASVIANVGVPILMYHNVNGAAVNDTNWVYAYNFTQQMDYLVANNWHTITGEDLYNYLYKGTAFPANPVWLTFDDSYQNVYEYALPVMQARGLKGSIFTNTQYMGQINTWDLGTGQPAHLHMTWSMLQQLVNANFSPDSHTQHHVDVRSLTNAQLQTEIWGTQRDVVSFLNNTPGTAFSYPYGFFNNAAEWFVSHSGFHAATIVGQAKQYTNNANMFELTRIGVTNSDTLTTFANKLNNP
jgi:peptidoglycan/xylan/chitin deacetylase (PgdA/CDA1 family)